MMSLAFLLLATAFVVTIAAALGKAPLWIAVLLIILVELLQHIPAA